jgi:hypothetical protein
MTAPDRNFRSFADETNQVRVGLHIDPREEGIDPATVDDVLKISHCRDWRLSQFTVLAGGLQRENAIDLNRDCARVTLENGTIEAGRQNAITIKGGAEDTTLRRIVIIRAGGHCDIELGNYSDQSRRRVRRTIIEDVSRSDGRPVRVRCGDADWPIVINSNVEILYVQSAAIKLYVRLKRLFPALIP